MGTLSRWHIDPAPQGLRIDRVDEFGTPVRVEAPASILYHLVGAFPQNLDNTGMHAPALPALDGRAPAAE